MTIPSALTPKYNDKSVIKRAEYNALVSLAHASNVPTTGVGDGNGGGGGFSYEGLLEKQGIPVFCATAIPQYSIFCMKMDATTNKARPLSLEVEQANDGNQQIYLTNAESDGRKDYNTADPSFCLAELIYAGKPIYARLYMGSGKVTPRIGYPCGIKPTTWAVDGDGIGFTCLALDVPNELALVVLAPTAQRWLGKPVSLIAKNGIKGNVELWSGASGAEVKINPTLTYTQVCNRTGGDIAATKFCEMIGIEGKKYLVPWEC